VRPSSLEVFRDSCWALPPPLLPWHTVCQGRVAHFPTARTGAAHAQCGVTYGMAMEGRIRPRQQLGPRRRLGTAMAVSTQVAVPILGVHPLRVRPEQILLEMVPVLQQQSPSMFPSSECTISHTRCTTQGPSGQGGGLGCETEASSKTIPDSYVPGHSCPGGGRVRHICRGIESEKSLVGEPRQCTQEHERRPTVGIFVCSDGHSNHASQATHNNFPRSSQPTRKRRDLRTKWKLAERK
jgi:hypothetical protein